MKLIFCIESDWEGSAKKQSSILPIMQCINAIYPSIKYIFRTANTREELTYCLKKFKQISKTNKDEFCVLFFSGHGSPGQIYFGGTPLTLHELAAEANKVQDNLFKGHLVHFDACSVIESDKEVINLIKETGAALVSGFSSDVDFVESLALELIYIDLLSENKPYEAYSKMIKTHSELCKRTKFKVIR